MLEDYSAQQPIATWNPARGVWETSQVNLLCGHSALWQEVWPTSGMTVNGRVYERQTQAHLISDSESSLLPTPITRDYKDGSAAQTRDGKVSTDTVARAVFNSGEVLLGTPRTSSANGSSEKQVDAGAPKARLEDQVHTNWGKFEPAIRRWEETLGRTAPEPTKPDGKDGAHRLSSAFTEWMMGLPEGWITGVGLTRNDELKAAGNGVCPQQAELALRELLQGVSFEKFEGGFTMLPTPTASDIYTADLASTQQKEGSMHSVTLPQAVRMVTGRISEGQELSTPDPLTDNTTIGRTQFTAEDKAVAN